MRVATFNVRYGTAEDGPDQWDSRKELLAETFARLDADIVGVQECLPFQADELAMRLTRMRHFGLGRYHGTAVDRPHESYSGEHCSIFYADERLRLESCGTFWHSGTPAVPASTTWGNDLPRTATWGVFEDCSTGGRFLFCSTHFHWDEPYVTNAGELMRGETARLAAGAPIILVGDFNAGPESPLHTLLTEDTVGSNGLRDLWNVLSMPEEGAGTYHGFTGEPKDRIDWVLASPEFVPLSIERATECRDGRYPSDHFPVVVELGGV